MIGEGDAAPEFSLPAVVDGEVTEVALADYLGDDVVVLAFYPADFNPCCSGEETDLDELDLFTMQKDVSILGLSADSVYSHRAFAEEYDLHVPLLADVRADVAEAYGVAVGDASGGYLTTRAVVVIDPAGEVQYAWQTETLERLPPVEDVREAVDAVGGSGTAEARYRVGHAHYVEGRRAFTTAMGEFEELEWMMAQNDFTRAEAEFAEAADQFDTAVRFSEDERARTYFERAEEKAEALWQAAEWLAGAASAYASGEGAKGEEMRSDAERPLETARDIHEPPDPDDFPPDDDPADGASEASVLPTDDGPAASLEADFDGETPEAEALADEMAGGDAGADEPTEPTAADDTATAEPDATDEGDGEEIDDEELEEITAELEEQTRQAEQERAAEPDDEADDTLVEPPDGNDDRDTTETRTADEQRTGEDGDPDAEDVERELDEEDIELDLADPTAGGESGSDEGDDEENEDEADDETDDIEGGDHGVPDSL